MATVAHTLSKILPRPIASLLRPYWHWIRDAAKFLFLQNGRFSYEFSSSACTASRLIDGKRFRVVVRSYQEFRRFHQFGLFPDDIVQRWMRWITDCEVLYDIGSANGLEGFFVYNRHGSKIVFVEPFTPSIETILKTACLICKETHSSQDFEIVQAACDTSPSHQRLYMHETPRPGVTNNSFAHLEEYDRGGRQDRKVVISQWVPSLSLDALHWDLGLPNATHVKIDIDGFEDRAMRGATQMLEDGQVKSWAIEINGRENLEEICALMDRYGYTDVGAWEHYPGNPEYTADHIFVRNDLVDTWQLAADST